MDAKVSAAGARKSKATSRTKRHNCMEIRRIPANNSAGVRKHWARHGLQLLSNS
jgi:hypothetical protein